MFSDLIIVIGLSFLGSVVALVGGVLFLTVKKWSQFLAKYSMPFAAGVMLTVSLIGLLPEAVELIGHSGFFIVLATFVLIYLFETLFFDLHHHNCGDEHSNHQATHLVIVGDLIHNFIDGVAIAVAFLTNPGLGLVTAVSTFLHEVPHEIGDFGVFLKAGWKKSKIIVVNLLSALITLLGSLLVFCFPLSDYLSGFLLAVSAGIFLYLSASDFVPQASKGIKKVSAAAILLLGVLLMFLTLKAVPHSHEHEDDHRPLEADRYQHSH